MCNLIGKLKSYLCYLCYLWGMGLDFQSFYKKKIFLGFLIWYMEITIETL